MRCKQVVASMFQYTAPDTCLSLLHPVYENFKKALSKSAAIKQERKEK
jgi:hypothetical protein